MAIEVTKVDGVYVVSEDQTWVPGLYTSVEAAEFACSVEPTKLFDLWMDRRPGLLTLEDLKALK
ncbi:MAG: hypothetical protein AAFW60_00480 [Pseudomonadota bacterium]